MIDFINSAAGLWTSVGVLLGLFLACFSLIMRVYMGKNKHFREKVKEIVQDVVNTQTIKNKAVDNNIDWGDEILSEALREIRAGEGRISADTNYSDFIDYYLNYKQLSTDAHLSRMISHSLWKEGDYIWSIGWASRALKRYGAIYPMHEKIEGGSFKYNEFTDDLFVLIVKNIEAVVSEIPEDFKDVSEVTDMLKEKDARIFKPKTVRMFKDVFDFYEKGYCSDLISRHRRVMDSIVSNFICLLILGAVINNVDIHYLKEDMKKISWFKKHEKHSLFELIDTTMNAKNKEDLMAECKEQMRRVLGILQADIENERTFVEI